jgi:hypothetical protein
MWSSIALKPIRTVSGSEASALMPRNLLSGVLAGQLELVCARTLSVKGEKQVGNVLGNRDAWSALH